MRAKSVGDGRAPFELAVEAKHLNPNGTLHGGVIYSLADSVVVQRTKRIGVLEAKVFGDGDPAGRHGDRHVLHPGPEELRSMAMTFGIHIGHMGGPLDEMRKLW